MSTRSAGASHTTASRPGGRRVVAALGVVFGDIGTSPLYALRESFTGAGHELPVTPDNVLGITSLILWSLIVVISVKYLAFVMRADNAGEGGILALTSLVPGAERAGRRLGPVVLLGLFGTALLYGDGMITPAISVLSAVEGIEVAAPGLRGLAVPLSVVILVALFTVQRFGTAGIGRVFGPVMLVWFATLAVLGIGRLVRDPGVLAALDPSRGLAFLLENGSVGFLALGSVFLAVTGGEALYADMGHFGRRPITIGWHAVVFPGLALNYLGQGATLLATPDAIDNPFYRLAPAVLLPLLLVLATAATVIASQALITGAFSLTMQASQLGYLPRLRIVHTSSMERGQVYVPTVNWLLLVACVALVVGFRSSSLLAAAYGVAVTITMTVTTLLLYVVATRRWRWPRAAVTVLCAAFLVIDLAFLGANLPKVPHGGWFPLVVGAVVVTLLSTWAAGRTLVRERSRRGQVPLRQFLDGALRRAPVRVPGTAVYLFGTPGVAPPPLVYNLRSNRVLHERVLLVHVITDPVPRQLPARRDRSTALGDGITEIELHYGFMERPRVGHDLATHASVDPQDTVYFLGRESVVPSPVPGLAPWRERLFALMRRNATPASQYFGLPPDRVIEIAALVEL